MKVYRWISRILSILLIIFISIFALDSLDNLPTFLIHLIPSFIIMTIIIISWKHNFVGGLLFLAVALFSLFFFHFQALIISIPLFIIGILFLAEKYLFKPKTGR